MLKRQELDEFLEEANLFKDEAQMITSKKDDNSYQLYKQYERTFRKLRKIQGAISASGR